MHFGSIALNANVFVFAVFGLFVGCGILFGEARLKKLTIGFLVGLFVADQLADFVVTQLAHASVTINDPSLVKLILMLAAVIPLSIGKTPSVGGRFSIDDLEREHIRAVVAACETLDEAAQVLGIEPSTLWRKRKRYGL